MATRLHLAQGRTRGRRGRRRQTSRAGRRARSRRRAAALTPTRRLTRCRPLLSGGGVRDRCTAAGDSGSLCVCVCAADRARPRQLSLGGPWRTTRRSGRSAAMLASQPAPSRRAIASITPTPCLPGVPSACPNHGPNPAAVLCSTGRACCRSLWVRPASLRSEVAHSCPDETPFWLPICRFTSRQQLLQGIARHEALKAKDKRDLQRRRKQKWRPVDDD